jgi:methanethiol S-methyltransferase
MNVPYPFLAGLFLLCLAIRGTYELLKEAGKIDLESKPVFIAIFSTMILLWASWFTLCPLDPSKVDLPRLLTASGLIIVVLGTLLAVGAFIQLRSVENVDHLVTTGLFKRLRHPMYLGFMSWILGWSIFHGAPVSLVIGSVAIASILWWRHLEERRLGQQFGDNYARYRAGTWW